MELIAIVPCAGKATRRHPETLHKPKILINYAGTPLIEYIVPPLFNAATIEKIIFVLSPKHGNQIIDYVRRNWTVEPPISYVWQNEPEGFGHAILQARSEVFSFRKWNPDVLILTDDGLRYSETRTKSPTDFIRSFTNRPTSTIGVQWKGNVKSHGMVIHDDKRRIVRLVEKPYWDKGGLVMTGIYYIKESRQLFRNLTKLVKSGRKLGGEFQLTHALQMTIDAGTDIKMYYHDWIDCGQSKHIDTYP